MGNSWSLSSISTGNLCKKPLNFSGLRYQAPVYTGLSYSEKNNGDRKANGDDPYTNNPDFNIVDEYLPDNSAACEPTYSKNTIELRLVSTGHKPVSKDVIKKIKIKNLKIGRMRDKYKPPYTYGLIGYSKWRPLLEYQFDNNDISPFIGKNYKPSENYDLSDFLDGFFIAPMYERILKLKDPSQFVNDPSCYTDVPIDYHLFTSPHEYYLPPEDFDSEFVYSSTQNSIQKYKKLRKKIGNKKIILGMINNDRFYLPLYRGKNEIFGDVLNFFTQYLQKTEEIFDGYVRYKVPGQFNLTSSSQEQPPPFDMKPSVDLLHSNFVYWPATYQETLENYHPKPLGYYQAWETGLLENGTYQFKISRMSWFQKKPWAFDWKLYKIPLNGEKELIFEKNDFFQGLNFFLELEESSQRMYQKR